MKGKGKIYRIDDWDKPEAVKCKSWSHQERLCDLKEKVSLHKKGDIYYISQFTRSKTGTSFSEIKQSEELASFFAERALSLQSIDKRSEIYFKKVKRDG